ncbi:MAG: hypothetical protein L0099_01265 [Acidobacteria bacterium]|nr:hypothetical protein [Acidobacteriota bacterium]
MSYGGKTKRHTPSASHRRRRQRRTFSLAPEVIEYIEQVQKKQDTPSLSAAFEAIVREQQQKEWMDRINAETTAYYDSLTEEEVAEQKAWGEVAARALLQSDEL